MSSEASNQTFGSSQGSGEQQEHEASASGSTVKRSLPSPAKAFMPSPKRSVSHTKTDTMRDLTKFSPQQLGAYLMTLQPFDNPLTKCSPGEIKHLCAISEKGGMITTQTQLLMITHPLLILVCQLVEAELSITDKLFCTLEPQEEKEGEDGGEEGEESDVKRELLYFGQVPMAVHEVDVNVARDRLRSKGLVGCSHIFSDYPPKFVNNLLLIVTDVSGATEVLGMMRGVEYPITYKSFNLLKSASLMKPLVVIEECVDFVNYVAGWIRSFVPDGGK